jgi:dTDP-4-amino-4,6-dideoxygalactose transaminase
MKIPFARVFCDGNELKYVREVLDSGWLTTAGKTLEFEKRFAAAVGAQHACAVNSCTAALHLALEALGIGPGDKVIVPTLTFTATAEVVRYLGADPLFVDVDYATRLITPEIVARAIEAHPQVKAVMVVHFGGQSAQLTTADANGILDICRARGVKVVEDAAHAFPSRWNGKPIGSLGDATCFSFYANKTITTGEGGMLTTNDDELARRVRIMRLHGINRDIWNRFTSNNGAWEYDVVAPGFKYNMPDLNAAIGLAQLERAEALRQARQQCVEFYLRALRDVPCLDLPRCNVPMSDHAWHLFPLVLKDDAPVSRNRFIELLNAQGVGTSVHYKPFHRMTYYRERYDLKPEDFPNAERIWRGCVTLPLYAGLREEELAYVVQVVRQVLTSEKC